MIVNPGECLLVEYFEAKKLPSASQWIVWS